MIRSACRDDVSPSKRWDMLGRELAASARRWSRIRDSKEGREGGGSVERRLRSDSSGDCEVEEEAIGRSNFLALLKRAATYQDEIDRQTPVLYGSGARVPIGLRWIRDQGREQWSSCVGGHLPRCAYKRLVF